MRRVVSSLAAAGERLVREREREREKPLSASML